MRVMIFAQKPQRRGAEVRAFELVHGLRRLGHKARTVYLYPYAGEKALPLAEEDRQLTGSETALLERAPGIDPRLLRQVRAQIDEFKPDIVQVNGSRSVKYGTTARRLAGKHADWRLVYRNIGDPRMWNRRRLGVWLYRKLFMSHVDGVVGVSEMSLKNAIEMYGLDGPSVCLPGGIDTDRLNPIEPRDVVRTREGAEPGSCVAVYVGNLAPEKRPDRFLRVLAKARETQPNLMGWLVGDGVLRPELEQLADSLGIRAAVRFLGYKETVADYLAAADLFALTSDTEGTPAVVLEAGYLGLPTVATSVGGVPEAVLHERTGLVHDRDDEDALAAALARLAGSSDERQAMGQAAREWVEGRFTLETVAEKYVAFYERVLRESRPNVATAPTID